MTIIIPAKRKFLAPPLVRTIDDQHDPLNLGLIGHWSMDAETIHGSRMLDLSGRDNHATLANGPPVVGGVVGQALSLNGTTQNGGFPVSASLQSLGAITTAAWVNPSSVANLQYAIRQGFEGTSQSAWALGVLNGGNIIFRIVTTYGHDVRSVVTVPTNTWSHIAATVVSGSVLGQVYLNGTPISAPGGDNPTFTFVFPNNSNAVSIGSSSNGAEFFAGSLDDIRVYNRSLSAAEVFRLYNNLARDRVPYQTRGRVKGPTGAASITGTLAVTEANDTIAAAGAVRVAGTLARTEAADTISAVGGVAVAGTLARTEANDTLAATGTVTALGAITGTLSAFQAAQMLIATGQIRVNGGLNVTQAAQTLAATGIVGSIVPPPSGQSVQVIVMS